MKYTYVDGSGNSYTFHNNQLIYKPMTPEMSSSGTYSGGDPYIIDLEKIKQVRLVDVFERALWSIADHCEQRTMGSGTLIKTMGQQSDKIYLSYKSELKKEVEALLQTVR